MDPASGENSRERTSRLLKERVRGYLDATCRQRMEKMSDEFAAQFSDPVERIIGMLGPTGKGRDACLGRCQGRLASLF